MMYIDPIRPDVLTRWFVRLNGKSRGQPLELYDVVEIRKFVVKLQKVVNVCSNEPDGWFELCDVNFIEEVSK